MTTTEPARLSIRDGGRREESFQALGGTFPNCNTAASAGGADACSQPKEYRSNASGNRAPSCLVHVLGREKGTLGSDELEGSFTV